MAPTLEARPTAASNEARPALKEQAKVVATELQGHLHAEREALEHSGRFPHDSETSREMPPNAQQETLRSQLEEVTARVAWMESHTLRLEDRAERAESASRQLQMKVERAEKSRLDAETAARTAQRAASRLERELHAVLMGDKNQREVCGNVPESGSRNLHAKDELERQQIAWREAEEELQSNLAEERERGDELAEKLKQVTSKVSDLDEELQKEREKAERLEQLLLDMRRVNSEQRQREKGLEDVRQHLIAKLEERQGSALSTSRSVAASKASVSSTPQGRKTTPLDVARDERDALHALLQSSQRQCDELRAEVTKLRAKSKSMDHTQNSFYSQSDTDVARGDMEHDQGFCRSQSDLHKSIQQTWQKITIDMQEQLSSTEGQLGLAQKQREQAEKQRELAEQQLGAERQCKEEAEGLVHALEQEIRLLEGSIREHPLEPDGKLDGALLKSGQIFDEIPEDRTCASDSESRLMTDTAGWPVLPARFSRRASEATSKGTPRASEAPGPGKCAPDSADSWGEKRSQADASPMNQMNWHVWRERGGATSLSSPAASEEPEVEFEPSPGIAVVDSAASGEALGGAALEQSAVAIREKNQVSRPVAATSISPTIQLVSPTLREEVPLSYQERMRLRRLALENVALIEANRKSRMLLDEMISRLQRMRSAAEDRGQQKAALLAEIAETAGLSEIFGKPPRNVFERLYWDALLRLRRLEQVTRRIHEEERSEMIRAASDSNLGAASVRLADQTSAVLAHFDHQGNQEWSLSTHAQVPGGGCISRSGCFSYEAVANAVPLAIKVGAATGAGSSTDLVVLGNKEVAYAAGVSAALAEQGAAPQDDDAGGESRAAKSADSTGPEAAPAGRGGVAATEETLPTLTRVPFSEPNLSQERPLGQLRSRRRTQRLHAGVRRSKSSEAPGAEADPGDASAEALVVQPPRLPLLNPDRPQRPPTWRLSTPPEPTAGRGPPVLVSSLQAQQAKSKHDTRWGGSVRPVESRCGGSSAGSLGLPTLSRTGARSFGGGYLTQLHRQPRMQPLGR